MRRVLVVAAAGVAVLAVAAVAVAQIIGGVPNANPRSGSPPNVVANGFALERVVNGNDTLENPAGIFARYGYLDDSTLQSDAQPTKTEPDQNTYLVSNRNLGGPTPGYDYGHHFLIQGHEVFTPSGATFNRAYFTRVNLDVDDPAHRVTLLNPLPKDATDSGGAFHRRLDVRPVQRPAAVYRRGRQRRGRLRPVADVERHDGA